MSKAYQYLFEIENTLRNVIKNRMHEAYGLDWERVAPRINKIPQKNFQTLRFHNLITWFKVYPPLQPVFPSKILSDLESLIPIRNKIAHCKLLTIQEFNDLRETYQLIFSWKKSI